MYTIDVKKMTVKERLQAMETIWNSLLVEESEIESPDWHAEILKETEKRVNEGKESILDWNEAKIQLKNHK